jgi:hypothetical protein
MVLAKLIMIWLLITLWSWCYWCRKTRDVAASPVAAGAEALAEATNDLMAKELYLEVAERWRQLAYWPKGTTGRPPQLAASHQKSPFVPAKAALRASLASTPSPLLILNLAISLAGGSIGVAVMCRWLNRASSARSLSSALPAVSLTT